MTPPLWPHPSPRGSYIISIEYLHHLRMLPQLFWPKGFWKDFKKIPISKIPMLKFDTPPPFVATLYSQGLWFEQTWNYLTWVHRNLKLFWPTSFSEDLKKKPNHINKFSKGLNYLLLKEDMTLNFTKLESHIPNNLLRQLLVHFLATFVKKEKHL